MNVFLTFAVFLSLCLRAQGENVPAIGELPASKVLFLGNSITLHAPAPNIGWTGNWGMAASSEDKDYVHLLTSKIAKAAGGDHPRTMVRNIADFERGYGEFETAARLKEELAFEADIVVIAIGENVAEIRSEPEAEKFSTAIKGLLSEIKTHGKPAIFVRSSFWPNAAKDDILRDVCAAEGGTFVDIGPLGSDAANKAPEFEHAGVAAHPGDRGMAAIADAIFEAILKRALPALILRGDTETEIAPHGTGNVYAPEVHLHDSRLLMWYGGQGKDGHDRIHLAESVDGKWTKRGVVVDCGSANHVNDPSVVRVGEIWWMFYTVAETAEWDEIAAATSEDGLHWTKRGVILGRGAGDGWDSGKVGRPSVLYEGGIFRMWYDAQPRPEAVGTSALAAEVKREGRAVGYAESLDGLTWRRRPEPVFREGAGAIHVSRRGERLIMLIESGSGIRWAQSDDGYDWKSRGQLTAVSGGDADRFGCVTPFLFDQFIYFGAAGRKTWDGNVIATKAVPLPE
ncbi:MAG: hypothetical protein R3F19_31545 [Verrucomicrobiales bacterium]